MEAANSSSDVLALLMFSSWSSSSQQSLNGVGLFQNRHEAKYIHVTVVMCISAHEQTQVNCQRSPSYMNPLCFHAYTILICLFTYVCFAVCANILIPWMQILYNMHNIFVIMHELLWHNNVLRAGYSHNVYLLLNYMCCFTSTSKWLLQF